MPEIGHCEINGVICSIHQLGSGAARSNTCWDCGYFNWAPDDIKFVEEHDHHREHLCPTCAVIRGMDKEHFEKNANDPRECPVKEFDENKCSTLRCSSVVGQTKHFLGDFTTTSLLKATNIETKEEVMLCPKCWVENAVAEVRRGKNYYDERPEDVLDQVSNACIILHTKPPTEQGKPEENSAGKKHSLTDPVEDETAVKKQCP